MSETSPNRFPTTRWTSVERAGGCGPTSSAALGRLVTHYLGPLRAHLILHKRLPPERADDLLQGFISDKVLERDLVGGAARGKGRFRTYLLVALHRFVSNQVRDEHRKRRSPEHLVSLQDAPDAIDRAPEASAAFELSWARQVLADAASRMLDDCRASGRTDVWGVFDGRVLAPTVEGAECVPYERLVEQFGLESVDAASNLLVTGKRMFARSLRGVVGEYTSDASEIEQEIGDLRQILSRARA
jgi:RNA polymerase sigma-70 factor (ECF subfamily)